MSKHASSSLLLNLSQRMGEKQVAGRQVASLVNEMNAFRIINCRKMTIVRLPLHNQTVSDICVHNKSACRVKLGCVCVLCLYVCRQRKCECVGLKSELKFAVFSYLANTASLRKSDKSAPKQNTSSSKGANKVFNILKCSLR